MYASMYVVYVCMYVCMYVCICTSRERELESMYVCMYGIYMYAGA